MYLFGEMKMLCCLVLHNLVSGEAWNISLKVVCFLNCINILSVQSTQPREPFSQHPFLHFCHCFKALRSTMFLVLFSMWVYSDCMFQDCLMVFFQIFLICMRQKGGIQIQ